MTTIALVGNPNSGKTTLFNALTGSNQRVGNWPGVTVEKKAGTVEISGKPCSLIDLPGVYSLGLNSSCSLDEQIATDYILSGQVDVIINVVDATNLERHLYLSSMLLELQIPMVVAVNMQDVAQQRKISIDNKKLSQQLGCAVSFVQANKEKGLSQLLQDVASATIPAKPELAIPADINEAINTLAAQNDSPYAQFQAKLKLMTEQLQTELTTDEDIDVIINDAHYDWVHQVSLQCVSQGGQSSEHLTAKIDKIILNRWLAIPIFLAVMYSLFLFAINIGGAFQDFFDLTTDAIFVKGLADTLHRWNWPAWAIALCANGFGKGVNTTVTFIPVITAMFFFLSMLENSGYMARAAFVVDRAMRLLGLPGKSFVPMIVGFGCNVPAIMAARTLETKRDQLLTVLMSPYMACSARLAIFAVFVAAFFPSGGQNVVFLLYLIGILMAVFTGMILRKTVLMGEASSLVIELPPYHMPSFKRLIKHTGYRLKFFLVRAGKLILPMCVLLGGLNALMLNGDISLLDASNESVLSWIGKSMTPIFAPMGITQENWPATVGLLTGTLAKEVVVGSLNSLYGQMLHASQAHPIPFDLLTSLKEAVMTIPENLGNLGEAIFNPISASSPDGDLSTSVYGVMVNHFNGAIGAFAYLLFVLLYLPCVSTIAAIRQEANKRWMWFSVLWSTGLAYLVAVCFYQIATFFYHPMQTLFWWGIAAATFVAGLSWLKAKQQIFNSVGVAI